MMWMLTAIVCAAAILADTILTEREASAVRRLAAVRRLRSRGGR